MIALSRAEFDRAVEDALAEIPEEFLPYLDNVMVEVRDRPDRRFQREHDVPPDLFGLYVGVPLEDQGPELAAMPLPHRIFIFSQNLCAACETRAELIDEIRITILHEIGHHFGLDEDRLDELGYG